MRRYQVCVLISSFSLRITSIKDLSFKILCKMNNIKYRKC
uniref:Uncharacterized protein n=1 Tax=Anguilla anguilla TaxID=7936 RepID=A0A0E9TY64_ANGAN